MKITHLQSSTQIVHIGDVKVLTDPWLINGEYYGSWYHYPPFPVEDITNLDYDFIYVSHIHPDHLSEKTFNQLPKKVPVIIHNYDAKFLKRKIEMLGFPVIECNHGKPFTFENNGTMTIYAADNCNPELCSKFLGCGVVEKKFGSTQIDSIAVFELEDKVIINTNDCPFELAETTIKRNEIHKKNVDALLVGYGGAGPYPQCFEFNSEEEKLSAAKAKEQQFLNQAMKYIQLIQPKCFVPFAGTYILGSRLSNLTEHRGVPSLKSAVQYLNNELGALNNGILLEQYDELDIKTLKKQPALKECNQTYEKYVKEITKNSLDYDNDNWNESELPELIAAAHQRFMSKAKEIGLNSKTQLIISSDQIAFSVNTDKEPILLDIQNTPEEPFVKISLNHNLLHRLLRGPRYAHWNNAEIGSHLRYQRRPNTFERGLYHCLCFLHQ